MIKLFKGAIAALLALALTYAPVATAQSITYAPNTTPIYAGDGVVASPSYSWSSVPSAGFYRVTGAQAGYASSSLIQFTFGLGNAELPSGGVYHFSSTANASGTPDVGISREASGIVAIGTGAQGSVLGTVKANQFIAGTNISIASKAVLDSPSDGVWRLGNNGGTQQATITVGASNLLTFQGGGSFAGPLSTTGNVNAGAAGTIFWNSRATLSSSADGVIVFGNNSGTQSASVTVGAGNTLTFQGPIASGTITATGSIYTQATTVSNLSTCNSGNKAARNFVTDATVAASGNFGAAVAGTGANNVPVYCDGTSWKIGQVANDNMSAQLREQADRLWSAFG